MEISCSIYPQTTQEENIWGDRETSWGNISWVGETKGIGDRSGPFAQ